MRARLITENVNLANVMISGYIYVSAKYRITDLHFHEKIRPELIKHAYGNVAGR